MSDTTSNSAPAPARRIHPAWMLASGNALFRIRNGLFPVIYVLLALFTRPAQFMGNPAWDRIVMTIGVLIALVGQAFRLFVIGFAYIKRGGKKRKVYAENLVVEGLYAHSRNPMYVGNFLIACGAGLVYGSLWMYVLVIPFFAWVYLAITAAEEQYLFEKFGPDYEAYMKSVNRFIPNFRGLSASLSTYHYRWRTVLAKDYGTIFSTIAGLTAIVMWKKCSIYGWEAKKGEILAIAWLFIPWVLFYGTARFLKLTGRLQEPGDQTANPSAPAQT